MRLRRLHGAIADAQWKAIAMDLDRHIAGRNVEDDERNSPMFHDEAFWLGWLETRAGRLQQRLQRLLGIAMPGRGSVVFETENENAALGIRKSRDIFRDLITNDLAIAWPLGPRRAFEKGLAIEVLAFVLREKGRDVETERLGHRCFLYRSVLRVATL